MGKRAAPKKVESTPMSDVEEKDPDSDQNAKKMKRDLADAKDDSSLSENEEKTGASAGDTVEKGEVSGLKGGDTGVSGDTGDKGASEQNEGDAEVIGDDGIGRTRKRVEDSHPEESPNKIIKGKEDAGSLEAIGGGAIAPAVDQAASMQSLPIAQGRSSGELTPPRAVESTTSPGSAIRCQDGVKANLLKARLDGGSGVTPGAKEIRLAELREMLPEVVESKEYGKANEIQIEIESLQQQLLQDDPHGSAVKVNDSRRVE